MIKISSDRWGYKIKLEGIRTPIIAKGLKQVYIAVAHYFGEKHDKENCVLCAEGEK